MLHLLFFRGHGLVPVFVRLLCWHWWRGQRWQAVPAHVAVAVPASTDTNVLYEYEAVVTGIQVSLLAREEIQEINPLSSCVELRVPDPAQAHAWLDLQIGRRYGFETAALTGLGIVSPPALDRWWRRIWEHLSGGRSGRTAPLHCSLLVQMALRAGGLDLLGRGDGLPVSPNDLLRNLK
jgi:hypothetical protein